MTSMVSMDFFAVPTATFRVLFVLVILSHSRRRVLHFNVTSNSSAEWTSQQVVEAFPSLLSSLPGVPTRLTRHPYLTGLRAAIVDKIAFLEEVDEEKPVIE